MSELDEIVQVIEQLRLSAKSGSLAYWYKIGDRFIIDYIEVSFLKKDRKEVIELLKKVERERNFLFWANSTTGEKFYNDNYDDIVNDLENQIKRPWIKSHYLIKRTEIIE